MIGLENKSERNDMLSSEFYYDFILGNPIHNLPGSVPNIRGQQNL